MLLSTRITIIAVCTILSLVLLKIHYSPSRVFIPQIASPTPVVIQNISTFREEKINPFWTTEQLTPKFAYVQYATDLDYLCNTITNFARLRRYGAKEDQVLIIPKTWMKGDSKPAKAMEKIQERYPHIVLHPIELLTTNKGDSTWKNSLTKLHAFGVTDYTRVLIFDSDSLVLNQMDHYFLAPMATIAVPRAYWLTNSGDHIGKQILGSHVMLLEPSDDMYRRVIDEATKSKEFDMEVINNMFNTSAMILPHRRLALLTGEFRAKDHSKYLAPNVDEEWNAMGEVSRSYLVHFSDWPLPKPWRRRTDAQWKAALPECDPKEKAREDRPKCADRVMWTGFYKDYDTEKEKLCADLL